MVMAAPGWGWLAGLGWPWLPTAGLGWLAGLAGLMRGWLALFHGKILKMCKTLPGNTFMYFSFVYKLMSFGSQSLAENDATGGVHIMDRDRLDVKMWANEKGDWESWETHKTSDSLSSDQVSCTMYCTVPCTMYCTVPCTVLYHVPCTMCYQVLTELI